MGRAVITSTLVAGSGGARRWPRWAALFCLVTLTFVTAGSCQRSQVRVSQERAIATAREAAQTQPQRTQVRLIRQGVGGRPFWAISLSSAGGGTVTVVRVDANTGKVASVERAAP
jgi:Peptidase propeptide and YPEB domain